MPPWEEPHTAAFGRPTRAPASLFFSALSPMVPSEQWRPQKFSEALAKNSAWSVVGVGGGEWGVGVGCRCLISKLGCPHASPFLLRLYVPAGSWGRDARASSKRP